MSSLLINRVVSFTQLALALLIIGAVGVDLLYSPEYSILLRLAALLLAALVIVAALSLLLVPAVAANSVDARAQEDLTVSATLPKLTPILTAVSQTMTIQLQAISSYSDVLTSASDRLNVDGSEENVKSIIVHLLAENRTMKAAAELAKSELHSKSMEISFLRRDLEAARRDADTDPLTQIANRRHILETLEARSAAPDPGSMFCLALLDIDHFKSINDTYGHQVGDVVLKTYAHEISRLLRGRDVVARYGGEEFLILLNNVSLEQAVSVIERVRSKLANIDWSEVEGSPNIGTVTSSIGLAARSIHEGVDQLIGRTDSLLYKAKSQGRNRVVWS